MILGPPGSGKGTYASRLGAKLGIPAIAMGDFLRHIIKEDTKLALKIREYMNKGDLVPDDIVNDILRKKLNQEEYKNGFILDGYPRTIKQAQNLDELVRIDAVIQLIVPDWIIIERLSSRRICKTCGEVYNIRFLKPRIEGLCDKCQSRLYQRFDDTLEVIQDRLDIYKKQTRPLLQYYRSKVSFIDYNCESPDIPPKIAVSEIIEGLKKHHLLETI